MTIDAIELPARIAATLRFETACAPEHFQMPYLRIDPDIKAVDADDLRRDLTARDRALLLVVAAMSPTAKVEEDGPIRIPDLPVRQALGMRTRRDEWEDARFDRFARSTMHAVGLDGMRVPTMTKGWRRRTISGAHLWNVDGGIRSAFAIGEGETVVEVPMLLLAGARSRYTLTMALRVLAWGAGQHPKKWLRWQKDVHRVLRIRLEDLRADLGIEDDVKPADVLRKAVQPAIDEIHRFTNWGVDVQAWRGPSLTKGKRGRLMGIDIVVPAAGRIVPVTPKAKAEIVALHGPDWTPPGSDATDEDLLNW